MKPLNATITYINDNCLDAWIPSLYEATPRRFVRNDEDGTWSTWTKRGPLRRRQVNGCFRFHLIDNDLIPAN